MFTAGFVHVNNVDQRTTSNHRTRGGAFYGGSVVLLVCIGLLQAVVLVAIFRRVRDNNRTRSVEIDDRLVTEFTDHVSAVLSFRRPEPGDADFLLEMAADDSAAAANGWADDQLAVMKHIVSSPTRFEERRRSELVAVERATGTPVGVATFSRSPLEPDTARSIGVQVHPDHRCVGYGRALTAAALVILRLTPGPIHVGTSQDNVGMRRIMAELGYDAEPGTRPFAAPNGTEMAAVWYQCGTDRPPPRIADPGRASPEQ